MSSERKKICIIGAGISGLSMAHCLKDVADVTIYEADTRPGGLVKCERVGGSLFHTCGGHVFNTKRADVMDFFRSFFDLEKEFHKTDRNSTVMYAEDRCIPYPIENHAWLFDDDTLAAVINDVMSLMKNDREPENFEDFLKMRFGETLYRLYFKPYNEKIWRCDLSTIPLSWLEGKLPMPSPQEIIYNNIRKVEEKKFVHSTFWYENTDGTQYLVDRLAGGLDIRYGVFVNEARKTAGGKWLVQGGEYDYVVFCGNIRQLGKIVSGLDAVWTDFTDGLEYHGTTTVFCEIAPNPYSWIYLPSQAYDAHRIICTGNFAQTNNSDGKMTGTVEFTDMVTEDEIKRQLELLPLRPRYLTHKYNKYTYPVQDAHTRMRIKELKQHMAADGFYMTGRFVDWEYYNMDAAMGAAIDLSKEIKAGLGDC